MLWALLVNIAICANILSYRSLDSFFAVFGLIAFFFFKKESKLSLKTPLKTESVLNILFLIFIISTSLGYLLTTDSLSYALSRIFDLRWILSFYTSLYLGYLISEENQKFLYYPPFLLILTTGLLGFYALHPNPDLVSIERRLTAFYENPNHLALALVFPWAFFLGKLLLAEPKQRTSNVFGVLTFLTTSAILFFTYSRTIWFAMLGTTAVGLLFISRQKALKLGLILCVTLGVSYLTNTFGFRDRLIYTLNFSPESSQSSRMVAWKTSWHVFLDHPLFGVGLDEINKYYPQQYEKLNIDPVLGAGHAHNQFLQLLAETGLVGFSALTTILIAGLFYFQRSFRKSKSLQNKAISLGAFLAIVALFLSSFTDTPIRIQEGRNYVLLILGVSLGYMRVNLYHKNGQIHEGK